MKYYIAENGQPSGPYEVSELFAHGLTGESLVWCESMTTWQAASSVPELATALFMSASQADEGATIDTGVWPENVQQESAAAPTQQTPIEVEQPQQPYRAQQPQQAQQPYQAQQAQPYQAQQPYGQPYQQPNGQQPYQAPYPYQNPVAQPMTWFTGSVVATVVSFLCCSPLSIVTGIVAIIKSNEVKSFNAMGRVNEAMSASKSARNWLIATVVLMAVWWIASMAWVAMLPDKADSLVSSITEEVEKSEVVLDDSVATTQDFVDEEAASDSINP